MSYSSGKAHCSSMGALLISGPMYEDCLKNTIDALNHLADCGYKVSASKAQICTQAVKFLGFLLEPGKRSLIREHRETIIQIQSPKTKIQLREFGGMAGYCHIGIPNSGLWVRLWKGQRTAPLNETRNVNGPLRP